jgi:hypothetical protein
VQLANLEKKDKAAAQVRLELVLRVLQENIKLKEHLGHTLPSAKIK